MQYLTAPVAYVFMVLAVLGTATAAVFNLYEMTAQPTRDWDAEIDRIVAQQQEKKRLALAPQSERSEPTRPAESRALLTADAEETTASIRPDDERAREPLAEKKAQAAAQTGKKPARRTARGGQRFVPAAFTNLPKFAAATAASALLLRLK